MALKVFNTLSRSLEEFKPIRQGEVGMYVCGITSYDYCHIGHARSYVFFDTARKYLEFLGYKVKYVQNFTDIDDKVIKRGNELGRNPLELSQEFIDQYFEDMDILNIKRADIYPKVTEHIQDILRAIEKLIENNHAYVVDGEVFYSVRSLPDYGKLSKRRIEQLEESAGARIRVDDAKKDPMDFTLWKPAKEGEPSWTSPWGKGRPGWHIECSVMSQKYLGETFDIHGGGQDLIFPHHENEIAQAEGITNRPFARYWLHNEFVNIRGEKMSKSLKNFTTLKEAFKLWSPHIIRFFLLSTHYRKPVNFSEENLEAANAGLGRIYNAVDALKEEIDSAGEGEADEAVVLALEKLRGKFIGEMDNDFNTSGAIAVLFELANYVNRELVGVGRNGETLSAALELFEEIEAVLGLTRSDDDADVDRDFVEKVEKLIEARDAAREMKNFAEADRLREELGKLGIEVQDTGDGAKWKIKR